MSLVSQSVTEAIILAGGMGSRLRSEVPDLPKPMAPVADRPFLEYLLDYLHGYHVSHVILSVGYKHQLIIQHFGNNYRGMKIDYAIEVEPLGTGGGLLMAVDKITGISPVVVMNGDTWFPVDLTTMAAFHQERNSLLTIAVHSLLNSGRYAGIEFDANKQIVNFVAQGQDGIQWINGGVYTISPQIIKEWHSLGIKLCALEQDLIPLSIKNKAAVFAFSGDYPFIDIGIPEDYQRASSVLHN